MALTEVAFVSVKPDGKAMNISCSIWRASTSCNSGEANEGWGLLIRGAEERGTGNVGPVSKGLENSMSPSTTGVHGAFGNTLMI